MPVTVKLLATLARFAPPQGPELPAKPGQTAGALLDALGVPPPAVTTILVNGQPADRDTPLADGDRLTALPTLSGG